MTNQLVGDVYERIIQDVIAQSSNDFEENGVSQTTLSELRQEWQHKLSQRGVAQMPWDPKPVQPAPVQASATSSGNANGVPQSSYSDYPTPTSTTQSNGSRIKTEPGTETSYNGLPNGYPQATGPPQGGLARAQQLVQQQYGTAANASLNAMQQRGGGLALPGQQQQAKPQGLQLPAHGNQPSHSQYTAQQQQQQAMRQQQQLQQQQAQPRIKVENESPHLAQGAFQQQPVMPNYSQTDGADDALEQWQSMLAQRRALGAEQMQQADRMMRDQVMQHSADLQSGLMVPLDEQPSSKVRKRKAAPAFAIQASSSAAPTIPQLDGDFDEDEEKPDIKDEDDENAINSDLDDSDDDDPNQMGDEDDENIDQILCTYDKVQRVKNKWKCILKDGVMSVNGKEWVFHKGNGEFEW